MRLDRMTKYMNFYLQEKKAKTGVWVALNSKSNAWLATFKWYPAWRQYIVQFDPEAIFNDGCLNDIYSFMRALHNKEITIEG